MYTLIENGKKYGYPECCITDFSNRIENDMYILPSRTQIRVSNKTGFIPCSYCSWKVLSKQCKLIDLIKNRKCKTLFPNSL